MSCCSCCTRVAGLAPSAPSWAPASSRYLELFPSLPPFSLSQLWTSSWYLASSVAPTWHMSRVPSPMSWRYLESSTSMQAMPPSSLSQVRALRSSSSRSWGTWSDWYLASSSSLLPSSSLVSPPLPGFSSSLVVTGVLHLVASMSSWFLRSSLGFSSPSLVTSTFLRIPRSSSGSSPSLIASVLPRSPSRALPGLLHAWFSPSRPPSALFPPTILRVAVLRAAHGLLQSGLLGQVVGAPPVVVLGAILVVSVASHLVVSLEVVVLASHPGFGLASPVVSVKSDGVNTDDPLK